MVKWVIPSLGNSQGDYLHFKFTAFGGSFSEVLVQLITHPIDSFNMIIRNHTEEHFGVGAKEEFFLYFALTGGVLLLRYPQYLIMLAPIIGQKLLHDDFVKWGINLHYSIEFAPILTFAVFKFISDFKPRVQVFLASGFLLLGVFMTAKSLHNRRSHFFVPEVLQFYSPAHWSQDFDVEKVHLEIERIPADAKVSACAPLAPHLAMRDYIYMFPYVLDADYVAVLLKKADFYPQTKEDFGFELEKLRNTGNWEVFYADDELLILKKK